MALLGGGKEVSDSRKYKGDVAGEEKTPRDSCKSRLYTRIEEARGGAPLRGEKRAEGRGGIVSPWGRQKIHRHSDP